ncbi:MAG: NAD(P)-dependent oxidoreductase [Desulfobacterales bacterium]|nr:NAD(P)-dependent oxidoreductase [Desulfobacterales bacterium]
MAVLITGGHGHIGSYAARYLVGEGEEVILLDTNPEVPDCLRDIEAQLTFIRGSVMDFAHLTDIFRRYRGRIDGIIHTVGIMGELVLDNPLGNVQLNIGGTQNILEIARQFGIPKVVYTSTGAVYGAATGHAVEDTYPVSPSDLYGATKASCEFLGQQYAAAFGFDFRISRVYFCYGPGKRPSRFIRLYRLAFGALEGLEDLRMDKGADQKLDFVYIEDAGRGTALIYLADQADHSVYNIATGVATRVGRVAELAQRHSCFDVTVEMGAGLLMQRCEALDITRARSDLGYEPRYDVETGIKEYAAWMESVL